MRNPNDKDKKIYCDLCCLQPNDSLVWNEHAAAAVVDGPTRFGPHAYMCERHLESGGYPGSRMNTRVNKEIV